MEMNNDPEWIKQRGTEEDGCHVSTGGLVSDIETAENERMDRWIADKVMGWTLDTTHNDPNSHPWWLGAMGVPMLPLDIFSPTTNRSDALDALEVWASANGTFLRIATISFQASYKHKCRTRVVYLRDGDREAGYGSNASLALAISLALCKATGMPEGKGEDAR